MHPTFTLAALHPTARIILAASRAAAQHAANDNAGLAWETRDRAPHADDSHTSALVLSRAAAAILDGLCREVEPHDWIVRAGRCGTRGGVELRARDAASRATLRQEKVLRALVRAAGVEVL